MDVGQDDLLQPYFDFGIEEECWQFDECAAMQAWPTQYGKAVFDVEYEITLRNHKDEAITVSVVENLFGDWTITQSSFKHEKESATRARFDVAVPAKGSAELTYTVEFRH